MDADEKYKALLRRFENLNGKIERLRQLFDRQYQLSKINAEMLAVLKECDEAMVYMSEYGIPLCLPDRVKAVIKKAGGYKND